MSYCLLKPIRVVEVEAWLAFISQGAAPAFGRDRVNMSKAC